MHLVNVSKIFHFGARKVEKKGHTGKVFIIFQTFDFPSGQSAVACSAGFVWNPKFNPRFHNPNNWWYIYLPYSNWKKKEIEQLQLLTKTLESITFSFWPKKRSSLFSVHHLYKRISTAEMLSIYHIFLDKMKWAIQFDKNKLSLDDMGKDSIVAPLNCFRMN